MQADGKLRRIPNAGWWDAIISLTACTRSSAKFLEKITRPGSIPGLRDIGEREGPARFMRSLG